MDEDVALETVNGGEQPPAGSGSEAVQDLDGDGHNAEGVPSGAVPDEDDVGGQVVRVRRLCCRLPMVAGRGRWIIAGPVADYRNVDPLLFSMAIIVEGLLQFSCREVYARAVPLLIKKGMYPSVAATYESVQYVSDEPDCNPSSAEEPSWETDDPDGLPVRRVLDRAAGAVRRSTGRVEAGSVKFISCVPPSSHPWCAHALRLRRRRDERRGAVAYKRALSSLTDNDERRMLRAANSSSLVAVRHATTYNVRSLAERARGLRALKKRPWRGVGAPSVIPPRKQLVAMKRRVFERSARVGHSMITLRVDGTAEEWNYVRNSGLHGVRLYKASDGTVKRLACHSHKQRKQERASVGATLGPDDNGDPTEGVDAIGARGRVGTGRVDGCGLPEGAVGHRLNAGHAGHEAPGSATAAAAVDGVVHDESQSPEEDVFAHDSPLNDWGGPPSATRAEGHLTLDELRILKSSTLENPDGTDPLVIVAVQFDIVAAIRAAIARRTKRCTVAGVVDGSAAWSLGSDGGPICHSSITLFTLTLSASWLVSGRTAMLPVMYILAGEHHMHSALGDTLDALLSAVVQATYEVPVATVEDEEVETDGDSDDSIAEEQSIYDWSGPRLVRIVGDFSILAHIMGLTGGSDDSRCAFSWPCFSENFLSLTSCAAHGGRPRTVADVGRQWELVCWQLARWSFLRADAASVGTGSVVARCSTCNTCTPLFSPLGIDFQCQSPGCAGHARAFDAVLPTPMRNMFNLLRRRAGGVRGYPVIRSVPILLQVPVLHCTGSVMKKITYLFLAELGDAAKALAKRGMYDVTGRNNLKDLYLREHIKLVALILACETVVGVEVDPVVLSMWSLALLMSAAWRQALTGPVEHRGKFVDLMELAAGLLAPLWSAVKPLDREKKGAGVASLYLHAALVHARDSMGENSPADAVITDDHVEGAIHDMARHVRTRVNNVARAQAVTEFQALVDDDASAVRRNSFAAELAVYTERIRICSCCENDLGEAQAKDIDAAVSRTDLSERIRSTQADAEEGSFVSLELPSCLIFRPQINDATGTPRVSKELKIARALQNRMSVVNVCVCGGAWNRRVGSFGKRLLALRDGAPLPAGTTELVAPDDCEQPGEDVVDLIHPSGADGARAHAPDQLARYGRSGALAPVAPDEARAWITRHTVACRRNGGACDGACAAEIDDVMGRVHDDAFEQDVAATDHDAHCDKEGGLDHELGHPTDVDTDVPFLAAEIFSHPGLRPYAPPRDVLNAVLSEDNHSFDGTVADSDASRHRIAEEDMLLRIFRYRMRQEPFLRWAEASSVHLSGMERAIASVMHKLHVWRRSLPGGNISTL